jgi:hypothetical protein
MRSMHTWGSLTKGQFMKVTLNWTHVRRNVQPLNDLVTSES